MSPSLHSSDIDVSMEVWLPRTMVGTHCSSIPVLCEKWDGVTHGTFGSGGTRACTWDWESMEVMPLGKPRSITGDRSLPAVCVGAVDNMALGCGLCFDLVSSSRCN